MSIRALPDLNGLPAEALRAMLVTTHEQLLSTTDKLAVAQEQLQSREREIEHLQLLLAKLHRMQFGRKSEKVARQIEQLELRLEELESNRKEKEPTAPEAMAIPTSVIPLTATAAKPTRRALPDHLPRETRCTSRKKRCARDARGNCAGWARISRKCWSTYAPVSE